ncbi:MAG: hypothetical protein IT376_10655 [Polyangiaceae bacterium]|nr:hypothetical protein [Polyangiaceae bacterium]
MEPAKRAAAVPDSRSPRGASGGGPRAGARGRRGSWRLRAALLRVLATLALLLAAPGSAELVREALDLATGAECCEADCDERSKDSCSGSCTHCGCCARPSAAPPATIAWPGGPAVVVIPFASAARGAPLPAYRDPPLRPPTRA